MDFSVCIYLKTLQIYELNPAVNCSPFRYLVRSCMYDFRQKNHLVLYLAVVLLFHSAKSRKLSQDLLLLSELNFLSCTSLCMEINELSVLAFVCVRARAFECVCVSSPSTLVSVKI